MSRVHNFKCKKCSQTFETNKLLSDHVNNMNKINTKTVLFACNVCEKTFTSQNSLGEHFANYRHVEFKCEKCNKSLQTKGDLIKHQMKSHRQLAVQLSNDSIEYKCNVCHKTYKSMNELRNHLIETICPNPPPPSVDNVPTPIIDNQLNKHSYNTHECSNGTECRFLRDNRCNFYHAIAEEPEINNVRGQWQQVNYQRRPTFHQTRSNGQQPHVNKSGVKWCRYMDGCNKGRACSLRHYNLDVPPLSVRPRQQ